MSQTIINIVQDKETTHDCDICGSPTHLLAVLPVWYHDYPIAHCKRCLATLMEQILTDLHLHIHWQDDLTEDSARFANYAENNNMSLEQLEFEETMETLPSDLSAQDCQMVIR